MKGQQVVREEILRQGDQSVSRTSFCLNLNALRALACISVICTHFVEYYGLKDQFRSLVYGGHMAVYFFFALSGYLLSLSLMKEIRQRLNLEKRQDRTEPGQDSEGLPLRIEIDEGEGIEKSEDQDSEFSPQVKAERLELADRLRLELCQLRALLKREKQPLVFSVLGKYLWNRTLRLFPLYYGCWCFLKFFARENTHVRSLQARNLWQDIILLKTFPGHLWTMRIEMMYYYYVVPVFIICLCIAFSLQKKGFKLVSTTCFCFMSCVLIFIAINKMNLEEDAMRPVQLFDKFPENLPPFCFGMLAALVNFALEQEFNSQQAAKTNLPYEEDRLLRSRDPEPEDLLSKAVSYLLKKYKWNIICLAVFLRILMLNPGVNKSLFSASDEIPKWQMANLNSYWYAIFILVNDTRGGFWKLTHPKPQPQLSPAELPFFSKTINYFGLWSYPIYLTHPISYVTLYHYFEKTNASLEIIALGILFCFALGGLADFVFDKMLINKLILGKCFRSKRK